MPRRETWWLALLGGLLVDSFMLGKQAAAKPREEPDDRTTSGSEAAAPDAPRQPGAGDPYVPFVAPQAAAAAPAVTPDDVVKATQSEMAEPIKRDLGSQIFFDARQTSMNRNLNQQVFEGDVVVIGAGTLIGADHVDLDRGANIARAQGHIVILNRNQLFLGDAVTYNLATGDFEITNALMLSNDTAEIQRVSNRVFGITSEDVAFEEARKVRLAELGEGKAAVRREADRRLRARKLGDALDVAPSAAAAAIGADLIDRYARLLEEEALVTKQENPALGRLPEERRDALKRRRAFWEQSKASPLATKAGALANVYLHVEGETLTRLNGNDYAARNALFTPCRCEPGESPAWAFRADEMQAQLGGYADLDHAVLEIKGIPVLYLPHITIPLKDKRQSGFLMPTITYDRLSGNIVNQPFYIDIAPDRDATVTTDFYEQRGTRLGVEYRVQQREYSGWEMRVEGIRDQLWLEERGTRQVLGDLYRNGLDYAHDPKNQDPGAGLGGFASAPTLSDQDYTARYLKSKSQYWDKVKINGAIVDPTTPTGYAAAQNAIDTYMSVPENSWRGSTSWNGVTYLAPRLSLVSNGEMVSDHRYLGDLYVADSFNTALYGTLPAKAFSTAKYQLNLDGKDYYAGVGGRYGDNYFTYDRYQGQQLPADFRVQSRFLTLTPETALVPVYAQLRGESLGIAEYRSDLGPAPPPDTYTLGDGSWRRAQVSEVAPLVTDRIIQVSQFADAESRYIDHQGLDQKNSEFRTWHAGLEFRLPFDGVGDLPAFLQTDDCGPQAGAPGLPNVAGQQAQQGVTQVAGPTGVPVLIGTPGGQSSGATALRKLENCARKDDPDWGRRQVHHYSVLTLRLSTRPTLVKKGPYTQTPEAEAPAAAKVAADRGQNLAFFATDIGPLPDEPAPDADVPDEERMKQQQRVDLSTHNTWHLSRRLWQRVAGEGAPKLDDVKPMDTQERARRELLYSLARPATGADDLYDAKRGRWLVDRYKLTDEDLGTPVSFDANIAYDFLDAEERRREKTANEAADRGTGARPFVPLVEAWKPATFTLGLTYANWTLTTGATYDVYLHTATTESISLTFPTVFSTNLQLNYLLSPTFIPDGTFQATAQRQANVVTSLIPAVTTTLAFWREAINNTPTSYIASVHTSIAVKYAPSSECWNLEFSRLKDYGVDELAAVYLLRFSLVLMGQERGLPDMSPGAQKEAERGRTL